MIIDFDWPLQAENFGDSIDESNFVVDKFWSSFLKKALNKSSVLFIGKRGSGKTMLLKFAYSSLLRDFSKSNRLPVFISFSAFLAKFAFPKIGEFSDKTKEIASELFKSYFHVIVLKQVVNAINSLNLKPTYNFKILGEKIKKNKPINPKLMEVIENQMKKDIVPRTILKSHDSGHSIELDAKIIKLAKKDRQKISIGTVEFRILESEAEIRKALETILEAYDLRQIILFIDEIPGLGYLQGDFFDLLYIFRDQPKIKFKIGSYPYYTEMGQYFDIPDDAESVNLDRRLFTPSVMGYYRYFKELLQLVLNEKEDTILNNLIEEEALKLLAIASGGNTRLFLTFIRDVGELCNSKIKIKDIDTYMESLYNHNFQLFIKENARRYSVDEDQCFMILDDISERLGKRNKSKKGNTTFIGISNEIYKKYENEINLLDYSRTLEFFDEKILSGSIGRGKRYILNLVVAGINKTFKYETRGIRTQLHTDLIPYLEEMQSQDRKITITRFGNGSKTKEKGKSKKPTDPMEEEINVLNFTKYITKLLLSGGFDTPGKINNSTKEDLKKVKGIGDKKALMIKSRVEEYISDNFI